MTDLAHHRASLDRGHRQPLIARYLAAFLAGGHAAPPETRVLGRFRRFTHFLTPF
jgi:hypothetical protein